MDSCHIFSFIFNTKKAKSELNKCFINIRDNVVAGRQSTKNYRQTAARQDSSLRADESCCANQKTKIKRDDEQDQTTEVCKYESTDGSSNKQAEVSSGTYRALLVTSNDDDDDNESDGLVQRQEKSNITSTSQESSPETIDMGPEEDKRSSSMDKRTLYVKNLVRSIESGRAFDISDKQGDQELIIIESSTLATSPSKGNQGNRKPVTLVRPLPPKAPPKSFRAKCIRVQLSLNKPIKIHQLFQDEQFLVRHFLPKLEPLDRCNAAQVCRLWRNLLYSNQSYWSGSLTGVIDFSQLRREHLVECIVNTLQSASQLKHNTALKQDPTSETGNISSSGDYNKEESSQYQDNNNDVATNLFGFDQDDVWRIQELCNRFAHRHSSFRSIEYSSTGNNSNGQQMANGIASNNYSTTSKSSSIPSQISSTFSSASLSSNLASISETNRIDLMREKLYLSLDSRGFDSICLYGATDEDIEDLVCKIPSSSHERIKIARLSNCSISNGGLEQFISAFNILVELELTGCNELTNSIELNPLMELRRLIITDCINIADGFAGKLMKILHRLTDLTLQVYHLTDAFIEFLIMNCNDTSRLKRLELLNCKEITSQSIMSIGKGFHQLEYLSISGSTKVNDDGIEMLAEHAGSQLSKLDLSWCLKITDSSLECIACELADTLTDLVLDRNINITDIGISYLASMKQLKSLQIRWCQRITDYGLESLIRLRSLEYLSLAGLNQISARSLLCLVEMDLLELELTNCPAANEDLVIFLSTKLPNCNIII